MAHVPATVIVGAQWGDEGKGKIVDLLAQESDLVCRYQGGPNAGHTIVVDGETYKIRAVPSGIITGKACAIGAGCVVDPEVLIGELDHLEGRGHATAGLVFLSGNAHLIMPWHVALDGARERKLGNLQIGTTRRGIGPAYADKATRIGIRVQDLLDPKILRQKIELAITEKNVWLERVYEIAPFDLEEVAAHLRGLRAATSPVHRRHLAPRRSRAPQRRQRAVRGRAGNAARPRPRHVPVRHLVEPDRCRGGSQLRDRAEPHRRDPRGLEGLRDPRRRRPVPVGDPGRGAAARTRARRRVRHRDRPGAPLRLARPAGAPLRGPGQRHHLARVHQARRALDLRRDSRLRALPAPRRNRDGRLPGPPVRLPPLPPGLGDAPRLGAGARRRRSFPTRPRATCASSRTPSASRSRSSAPGRAARPC